MGFSWNNLGILTPAEQFGKPQEDDKYLYIYNHEGDWRKISKAKYSSILPNLRGKIEALIGKPVLFRTSQNTASWTPAEWFSDLDIDVDAMKSAENKLPFTQSIFNESSEPAPESEKVLIAKIAVLEADKRKMEAELIVQSENHQKARMNDSNKMEELKAEKNNLIKERSELELEFAKLKEQANEEIGQLPPERQKEITSDAEALEKMELIGSNQLVTVRGHPAREFALRIGVALPPHQFKVNIKILQHIQLNDYRVALTTFDEREAIVSLRLDKYRNIYVASVRNGMGPNWYKLFETVKGVDEASYKNRDLTNEEFLKIHHEVISRSGASDFS